MSSLPARLAGRLWPRWGMRPVTRISLGLTALLISLLLVADLVLGVVPGHGQYERMLRKRVAENLAVQLTSLLQSGDHAALGKTIQQVLARNADVRSISVHRHDGALVMQRGELPSLAERSQEQASDLNHLRVPILAGRQLWGEVEMTFVPLASGGLRQWLAQPGVQLLVVLGLGGFLLSHAYLSRAMQYLNPSATIPDRVRRAYDNLTEGLLILDQQARIVLANAAFRRMHPAAQVDLNGQPIQSLRWLLNGRDEGQPEVLPWERTLRSAENVTDEVLRLPRPGEPDLHLLVTSAPVVDDRGKVRGCMVSFNDETALHRSHADLRQALAEVERAKAEVDAKNQELQRLASRDPMTGCYNRRAFFEAAEVAFDAARAAHSGLCCIMSDIDHFKSFNDTYGHAVGDQVIQVVARALTGGIRPTDILCRYGGEEFCIVLPGSTPAVAAEVAERLRAEIESHAQSAIRGTQVRQITSSFGVASLLTGAKTLKELIDHADQALYRSKESGRNRVTVHERELA
mgnify:CR=1 FL=1